VRIRASTKTAEREPMASFRVLHEAFDVVSEYDGVQRPAWKLNHSSERLIVDPSCDVQKSHGRNHFHPMEGLELARGVCMYGRWTMQR
jgi:hypothetical protein